MKKQEEKHKQVEQILERLEKLAGTPYFDESDFWEKYWDEFCSLESQLITSIAQIIKSEDRDYDYSLLAERWGNENFWAEIRENVEKETRVYVKMRVLRELTPDERVKKYKEIFGILYDEHETAEYICNKMDLDSEIVAAYLQVLRFCENSIVNHFFSKRLFQLRLRTDYGFQGEESETLWQLYNENWRDVEKIAYNNRLSNIEYRISKLMEQVESVSNEMDMLECFLDYLDMGTKVND